MENGPVEIVSFPPGRAWWILPVGFVPLPGRVNTNKKPPFCWLNPMKNHQEKPQRLTTMKNHH